MINLIGITGYKGSGKDEVGKMIRYLEYLDQKSKILTPHIHSYIRLRDDPIMIASQPWETKKFALKLKLMMCAFLNCTLEDLEHEQFKQKKFFGKTVRHLLQTIGTEWGRNLVDKEVWVKSLFTDWVGCKGNTKDWVCNCVGGFCENPQKWIITDVRFHNEVAAILDREGVMIRVNRFKNEDLHDSEIEIPKLIVNYEIDNTGTLEELLRQVEEIYLKIVKL